MQFSGLIPSSVKVCWEFVHIVLESFWEEDSPYDSDLIEEGIAQTSLLILSRASTVGPEGCIRTLSRVLTFAFRVFVV